MASDLPKVSANPLRGLPGPDLAPAHPTSSESRWPERCRHLATPGSPPWDLGNDTEGLVDNLVTGRAVSQRTHPHRRARGPSRAQAGGPARPPAPRGLRRGRGWRGRPAPLADLRPAPRPPLGAGSAVASLEDSVQPGSRRPPAFFLRALLLRAPRPTPIGTLARCPAPPAGSPALRFLRKGFTWPPSSACPCRHTVGARDTESVAPWCRQGWGREVGGTRGSPSYPAPHRLSPKPTGGGLGCWVSPIPPPGAIRTLWGLHCSPPGRGLWGAGGRGGRGAGGPRGPAWRARGTVASGFP